MSDLPVIELDPAADELVSEARQQLSLPGQLDLVKALLRAVLDDPQFADQADAQQILGLDYLEQGLAELRPN